MQRTLQTSLPLFLAALALLAACSPSPAATPIPTLSLDLPDASATGLVKASAVVVPAQDSRLSFVISGTMTEMRVQAGDRVQAGQALASLDTTVLEYDMAAAQAALAEAELEVEIQKQPRKRFNSNNFNFEYASVPGEVILKAESIVDQRRFALEAAKASLAQTTLLAPFDGSVIEVDVSPGEYVNAGQVVITLAKLDKLQVKTTDLSELDVAAVEIGRPATVFVEALDREFPGTVTVISPISETIGGDVVFPVTIQFDEQPSDLLWGMSAEVEIKGE